MTEILTSAQMRSIESAAIDSGAVSGLALMERAGAGVVAAVLDQWPRLAQGAHRAVVLCGPGNNGGDGFVIARLLHARGWAVSVYMLGGADSLPPDARANHDRWRALGPVQPLDAVQPGDLAAAALVVDALFGTGLTRGLEAPVLRRLAAMVAEHSAPVVAVDIPSGLSADTGVPPGDGVALRADLTVSFHGPKQGHVTGHGPALSGRLVIADIGLAPWDHHRHDA